MLEKKTAGVEEMNKIQTLTVWDNYGTKLPEKLGFYQSTYHSFQILIRPAQDTALVQGSIL